MKICILGLGYIGLPTALMFASNETYVHGVDTNQEIIKKLNNKDLHMYEPGLDDLFTKAIDSGKISFSTAPVQSDVFIISVPTPINEDKTGNLSFVVNAVEMISPYLQKGNLVILESTVPPKTVINTLVPLLEKTKLTIGKELFIAYSPERVLPSNLLNEIINNDRIVGGINQKSTMMAVQLYKIFVKGKIHTTDATTAEMVKLIENTYRDVNIAFANELAKIGESLEINIWEAIELANNHPRVNIHKPGPGVGGHCIAVDPWFIIEQDKINSKLIKLARNINDQIPERVVEIITDITKDFKNPVISILGLAFKKNIDDIRESPSINIINRLKEKGIIIKAYDPYVKKSADYMKETLEEALKGSDCIVILTDHHNFKSIDFNKYKQYIRGNSILDTRNLLNRNDIESQGFVYYLLGSKMNVFDKTNK